uniref:RAP domain-containing protein n=1 Tax=Anopheles farauti TaxID=69004 RepID=A0A182Q0T6_9DIPT
MFKARRILSLLVHHSIRQPGSSIRQLHPTACQAVKKFVDSENDYANAVLRNVRLEQPELHAGPAAPGGDEEQALQELSQIVREGGTGLQDARHSEFVARFVRLVPQFSDEQLARTLDTLAAIEEVRSIYDPHYLSLWTTLDSECLERVTRWNVEWLLHMADRWYPLRLAKQGRFVNKAIWKISNKLRKLPPAQLVRTVFYINLTRVPVENMMDIEVNFQQNFDAFTIDDVAVLCMGFFKTETPVRSAELLEQIYQRVTEHAHTVEDIALTAILKLLRYSSRIPHVPSMQRLLDVLVAEIPRLSHLACLHIALLGSDIHVCHRESLELIVQKFLPAVSTLRLKDMERIAFVLAHGNVSLPGACDTHLLQAILAELPNRVQEIVQYPRCYIALLHFLALRHVYDAGFVSGAFEQRFLQLAYGRNIAGAGREAVALDAFTAINLPVYDGNRFPPQAFRLVCKLTQDYLPNPNYKLTKSDRMLLDIQETFGGMVGEPCRIMHLLPHYQRPDMLFCCDRTTRRVVPLEPLLGTEVTNTHEIRTRESILRERSSEDQLRLVAIVVGSWNCYVRDERRRTGGYAMKLEQLRQLQYETVEIPWYEWPYYSRDDMRKYLEAKLSPYLSKPCRQTAVVK